MEISHRKEKILSLIIEHYIETGEPVGSKTLSASLDNAVSSATIRNDMAWLSEKGFLIQPHTSSGRIPSQKGYRHYIDHLMEKQFLSKEDQNHIDAVLLDASRDPERFLESACAILADMTGLAAVSTTPSDNRAKIIRIELIPVGIRSVLILTMTSTGLLKSRVCRLDVDTDPEILGVLRKVLNDYFRGRELRQITLAFIQTLAVSLGEMTLVLMPLFVAVHELARDAFDAQLLLEGQSNILSIPEFDAVSAKIVLEFLTHREKLMALLSKGDGAAKAYIGNETGRPELDISSIIVSPYDLGGNGTGKIAVIGSTRMDYPKLLAHLEYFASMIGKLLSFDDE